MNNLEIKIKEFLEVIRETKEFQSYQKANDIFQSDKNAKKLLQDFQEARQTLAIFQQGGFSGFEEQEEKTKKLLAEVQNNKIINDWLQSQHKLQELIGKLATSLSNGLGLPFVLPQKTGCCG